MRAEAAAIALRVLNNTQDSIDTYARSQQQNNKNIAIPELVSDIDTNKICPDLDKNEWYYDEVTKLLATGIMQGDETGLFRPNDNITRAETAVIAVKLYEYVRDNLKVQNVGKLNSVTLTDIYPTDWFYEVVRAAAGYGLITGDSEWTFRPYDNITRAEFTSIIIRVMKNIDDMLISLCEV
ncbi:MAG: S-layer homology domain-containing protein [Clostridiales bacterium]|nr:S-layer homology domain-containing protein [Clostridiales bacterium]